MQLFLHTGVVRRTDERHLESGVSVEFSVDNDRMQDTRRARGGAAEIER